MRFIGSKISLLEYIDSFMKKYLDGNENIFCDIFAGTGIISKYFKPRYEIISNDILNFSYNIQKATIENNKKPDFKQLIKKGIKDPFNFLENTRIDEKNNFFITNNYSPNDVCKRMYFTEENANRIDFIRNTIDFWNEKKFINNTEYFYLLACLIEGVPFVSNITGTYGAYLKHWDKRALKNFEMIRLDVFDNKRSNTSFNKDAFKLLNEVEGDILYLDPPYNSRQYVPNYHILETISLNDNPKIKGVTGIREYNDQKSPFCIKSDARDALEKLISDAKFENFFLSYSTDGIIKVNEIEDILKKYAVLNSFKKKSISYRKYKSKKTKEGYPLKELLFYFKKPIKRKIVSYSKNKIIENNILDTKKYIKSPLNYIGGKYKLLPQIIPYLPKKIDTFVDLFAGGCNMGINVDCNKVIFNDINSKIIELFNTLKRTDIDVILKQIDKNILKYKLSKENNEGYNDFRDYYNKKGTPIDLFTLVCFSFNYQFRFNNKLEYNNPFGRNRSHFSEQMKQNLILFVSKIQSKDCDFINIDFVDFDTKILKKDDFVYCDPPYFITTGSYNDGNRGFKDWKINQELELYKFLDKLHNNKIKFALSNVLEHKGKKNEILEKWAKNYNVIDLNFDYSNASYNTKRGESREVLIIN